jgi:hypothetical protein
MANFNIDYLVIAGGGGGSSASSGYAGGGAGGAGGYRTSYGTGNISGGNSPVESVLNLTTGTSYTITVGDGGAGGPAASPINAAPPPGVKGDDSVFASITSEGGGYGVGQNQGTGGSGGSAGGGGGGSSPGSGGSGTSGQGTNGGTGTSNCPTNACLLGGGGGGASQAGSSVQGGKGGDGLSSSITGSSVIRAGGGSGGSYGPIGWNDPIAGGAGGGGDAGVLANGLVGQPGTTNTGGGGGGATWYTNQNSKKGGDGGSGIVILRYATADANYTTTGSTPTEDTTTIPGQTILSFTTVGTGTITFIAPPPPPFDGTRATTHVTGFKKTGISEGLKLPSGTNANQPIGAQGMIRNDTEQTVDNSASAITHYNGTNWQYFAATESPHVVYPTSLKMYLDASNTTSYPGTGSTWFDLTSNGNNGTLSTPSWNSNYFHFNGTSDIVTTSGFYGFSVQTWAVWVNPDVLERGEFMQTYPSGTIPQGAMYIEMSNTSGNVEAGVRNSSGSTISVTSTATLTAGAWTHVAVTSDGSNIKIYIGNAAPVSAAATVSSLSTNTQSLVLGYEPRNTRLWFDGKMSKVRVYDTALTQSEINVLVAEGSGA